MIESKGLLYIRCEGVFFLRGADDCEYSRLEKFRQL